MGERSQVSASRGAGRRRLLARRLIASEPANANDLQHRLLFEQNPLPMMVYDRETLRVLAVSDSAVAFYGYSRQEFLALTLRDLTPVADHDQLDRFLAANLSAERPGQQGGLRRHCRSDGTVVEVDITGDDIDFGGRDARIILCQDLTDRNRVMAELVAAREQLSARVEEQQLLFDRNPQPLLVYDSETLRIIAVSDAATHSNGYSRDEFLAMTLFDLAPEDDHAGMRNYARTHRGERFGFQEARPRRHRCKDGTVIDVEVTSDDLTYGGRNCRICLCLDVTERNRASAELAIARDQAVEASNMKSAFLANMSHEIRTPMNGVIGMTELLLGMELGEEQRECAEQIARSGEQMLAIINDILDLSKIETGHLELDVVDFDLHATVRETCSIADVAARAKGLFLGVQLDEDVPRRARGDGRRLRQVLLNLVSNAVKFTHAGSVVVRISRVAPAALGDGVIRFEVIDSGIGIDPGSMQRMFEPFTQADVSTTRLYGGTGLGLAIARELVELMGGTIEAESHPDRGSTFRFELVLASPCAAEETPATRETPLAGAAWLTPPLVLVADDSQINQIVAARALERCGCEVDVVGDGRDALEALRTKRYDAVLMDCQMPGMDGYQATTELRRREPAPSRTPVIAMTAQAMDGDRRRCLEAGMDDYISKPMAFQELRSLLFKWIPIAEPESAGIDPSSGP